MNMQKHKSGFAMMAFLIVWGLGATVGCHDKDRANRDIQMWCDMTVENLRPGSGVLWYQAARFEDWVERGPSQLAIDALETYGASIRSQQARSGRRALTVTEHSDALTAALKSAGLSVPDCQVHLAHLAHIDAYLDRMDEFDPLCEAYETAWVIAGARDVNEEEFARILRESVARWKAEKARSREVVEMVDSLLAIAPRERGKEIRSRIEKYMTGPGYFGRCAKLVWDAEESAGMPKSAIR